MAGRWYFEVLGVSIGGRWKLGAKIRLWEVRCVIVLCGLIDVSVVVGKQLVICM